MDLAVLATPSPIEVECKEYLSNLFNLAESVKARSVLELGLGWGYSAKAFALSLSKRRPSTLTSIDITTGRLNRENEGFIRESGVDWRIHIAATVNVDAAALGPIDILYMDSSPDPKVIDADYARFGPLVRKGGLVIIDGVVGQPGPSEFALKHHMRTFKYSLDYAHGVMAI